MTTIQILAMIGGITVIVAAAARIPVALAEFLRACIPVIAAARELRITFSRPPSRGGRGSRAAAQGVPPGRR